MPKVKYPIFKSLHRGEKGFTLIELLIVVAILGIIAAVIIPNIGTFMSMGTVSAANSEAENVKTASLAYYADAQVWPAHTGDSVMVNNVTYSFTDYYAGTLKASYSFDTDGFLDGVGDPGGTGGGTLSSGYDNIHWANPSGGATGHGQWVRD
jgi:prepilin-type N-terminal cleavage/methylation domain-containing protein